MIPLQVVMRDEGANTRPEMVLRSMTKSTEVANQPTGGQHFHCEEIRRRYGSPMRVQERAPGYSLASLRGGFDTVLHDDALHRVSANVMAQVRAVGWGLPSRSRLLWYSLDWGL